ncbi:MAG: aminotransferase class I/II-fold pyridoxal phosphate-dependent enzyme [Mariprofundaceae bacterium]|nr:aminotransferase class I/II-fold pyridoxal phosphate-dependent enzyme [Mariprofundaceae bacterium]
MIITQSRLEKLGPYPFQRLSDLLAPYDAADLDFIDAGAGEPRLPLPEFVAPILAQQLSGFSKYPPTGGILALRQSIAGWLMRRYDLNDVNAETQVLSANGTREALFAVAHALIEPEASVKPYVLMPNPMYQIYLGATWTAGGTPYLLPCESDHDFAPNLDAIPEEVWRKTRMVYVCSPSNPTGWVASKNYLHCLIELAHRYDFYVLSDECYSEIYWQHAPVGLLEVAEQSGYENFSRCVVFNSLSKRSALPGLRSGFIAGDANVIALFAKLRSYTGPATPLPLQHVAAAAWQDEAHVVQNLAVYRSSLAAFFNVYPGAVPEGSFFVWLPVADDKAFAIAAYRDCAVKLLPGSFLATEDEHGNNPGKGYVRLALVDGPEKAAELAQRLLTIRI